MEERVLVSIAYNDVLFVNAINMNATSTTNSRKKINVISSRPISFFLVCHQALRNDALLISTPKLANHLMVTKVS